MRLLGHLARSARDHRLVLIGAAVLAGSLASTLPAAAAPTGGYVVFTQCPVREAHVNGCAYAPTETGEITLGKETVPLTGALALQGGLFREEEPFVKQFAPALNGETLTRVPQKIPGGLSGLVKCSEIKSAGVIEIGLRATCEEALREGLTSVNAITELATPANSVVFNTRARETGEGPALVLPIKVRLENPLLGRECYIGSNAHPITLRLTTGATSPAPPNKPIRGNPGVESTKEAGGILVIKKLSLVDNSFSVPATTGCSLYGLLNAVIDSRIGLPSAAGRNAAIFDDRVEISNSEVVEEESEG